MGVLFSAVTLTAGDKQAEFLVAGIPRDTDDLEGWTAYDCFMEKLNSEQEVDVNAQAYIYGEGETVKANPEEIAYFTKRIEMDENFLSKHCDNTSESSFTIYTSPDYMSESNIVL